MAVVPVAASRMQRLVPPLSMAVPLAIIGVAVLPIPLATAQALGLTPQQTGAWLFALYAIPGFLSLLLSRVYHQPLFLGWNVAIIVFLASLAGQVGYTDLLGAALVGGAIVALLGALGLTARVAALVPAPVVFAVVAASVFPFVVRIFDALGQERIVIAGTLLAYVLGRRFLDARIPPILLAVALMALTRGSVGNVVMAITIAEIPRVSRLVRSVVLSLREQPYVDAAVAAGTRTPMIILRHILPNTLAPLTVQATYICASAMIIEAILSFIGAGTPPTIPSWGNIMAEGRALWQVKPFIIFFPAVFLSLTVLAVNLLGDGLRDALDPRMAKRL